MDQPVHRPQVDYGVCPTSLLSTLDFAHNGLLVFTFFLLEVKLCTTQPLFVSLTGIQLLSLYPSLDSTYRIWCSVCRRLLHSIRCARRLGCNPNPACRDVPTRIPCHLPRSGISSWKRTFLIVSKDSICQSEQDVDNIVLTYTDGLLRICSDRSECVSY